MADANKSDGNGTSINVSIGKEIDRSLADIVSALLKPAATEIGSLLGDSIGIVSDRIRQKRERNAQIGLAEVRKKLDAASVEMKDITPPKEEELYLLINGLSLSDDESLRDLWAGLFARALEPDSKVTAERPFLSVLQSLSPTDAKIIDFLAFTIKTDSEIRRKAQEFRPKNLKSITAEEAEWDQIRAELAALQKEAIQSIRDKAAVYGIDDLDGGGWPDNLIRQGVIERIPTPPAQTGSMNVRSLNQEGIDAIIRHLNRQIENMSNVATRNSSPPRRVFGKGVFGPQIQLEVRFTRFGKQLAEACGLL